MWRPRDGRNDGRVNREPRRPPRAAGSRADVMGRVTPVSQLKRCSLHYLALPTATHRPGGRMGGRDDQEGVGGG